MSDQDISRSANFLVREHTATASPASLRSVRMPILRVRHSAGRRTQNNASSKDKHEEGKGIGSL